MIGKMHWHEDLVVLKYVDLSEEREVIYKIHVLLVIITAIVTSSFHIIYL